MTDTKNKKLKPIPKFKNEEEEFKFWLEADSTEYFDYSKAKRVKFVQRPKKKSISLRLPEPMLEDLKALAIKQDVPYQSLMKIMLSKALYGDSMEKV
jgi:predicted DNA binding CopG/RHH family protein